MHLLLDGPDAREEFRREFLGLGSPERVAKEGARLRARYGLRTPDALHLATALVHRATAFLTNDQEFRKAQGCGLEILILDEIFPSSP